MLITGDTTSLVHHSVPFYGDQLTRVRLQGAKQLRTHGQSRRERFDDVGPILCTLWHMKQDFLHVCIKQMTNKIHPLAALTKNYDGPEPSGNKTIIKVGHWLL